MKKYRYLSNMTTNVTKRLSKNHTCYMFCLETETQLAPLFMEHISLIKCKSSVFKQLSFETHLTSNLPLDSLTI